MKIQRVPLSGGRPKGQVGAPAGTLRRRRSLALRPHDLIWRAGFVLPFVLIAVATLAPLAVRASDPTPTVWTGGGSATGTGNGSVPQTGNTVVHDGTSGLAEFTYDFNACQHAFGTGISGCQGPGDSGSWDFHTTAAGAGQVHLDYEYHGFHAYFVVTASLRVYRTSATLGNTLQTLVNAGPENCCTTPSGGFDYSGSVDLTVASGDTYGFQMSGANGDADSRLQGTLSVGTNVVAAGGFEQGFPAVATDPVQVAPGETSIPGWSVANGAVDWNAGRFQAAEGSHSLELDGGPGILLFPVGQISQSIPTLPGVLYNVHFSYSANPDRFLPTLECGLIPNTNPGVAVLWDATQLGGAATYYTFANSATDMHWLTQDYQIRATNATTTLRFSSVDIAKGCGIVLDDISVIPVIPAPDFTIDAGSASVQLVPGGSVDIPITTTALHGTESVTLSTDVAPEPGTNLSTVSLDTNQITSGDQATLTITAGALASPGSYTVTVTGTDGPTTHAASVNVQIVAASDSPQHPFAQTVNTAGDHDDGTCGLQDCTLREAINASNDNPAEGPNTIGFHIAGSGAQVINLSSPLPDVTVPTVIDGTTEPEATCGVSPAPTVEINGADAGPTADGLTTDGAAEGISGAENSTIKGLIIDGFGGSGIHAGADSITIQCNVIGTAAHPNGGNGVTLAAVSGATVGSDLDGTGDAAEFNVISHDNGAGIAVTSSGTTSGDRLDGNVIEANGGLGIDLGDPGVTPNDPGDFDSGPNGLANSPIVTRAISGTGGGIAGRLNATPADTQGITLFYTTTCDPSGSGEGGVRIGTVPVTTDASGDAQFVVSMPGLPATGFITATATGSDLSTSEFSACAALGPGNDSWPNALDISSTPNVSGVLDAPGQSRWYRFAVAPGSQIHVNLGNLPADYDLVLFKDISQAFSQLTTASDLNKLSAEFAGQAFTGQAFTGQAFTGQAFTADSFSGQAFTGQAFTGQAFTGQAFTGQAFTGQAFTGQAFTGQAFTGQAFTAQAFTGQAFTGSASAGQAFTGSASAGQAFTAQAFTSAQVRSVLAVSAGTGTGPESIAENTWNNTGYFYVRVTGHNGAFDVQQPFSLQVTATDTSCADVHPIGSAPSAVLTTTTKSVILANLTGPDRIAGSAGDLLTLTDRLGTFAGRSEVGGVVIDVGADPRIQQLNAQADANPTCVYAKNLVADGLKDIVDSYRPHNPGLSYVVLVGGDDAIPFFRYADQAGLAPESGYIPPVKDTSASEASLRLNYTMSQDAYGADTQISQGANAFPVPDLAVGRLVETAAEATGMLDAYMDPTHATAGVVNTPTRSLVTGYDFLQDAADAVQGDLSAGLGAGGTADTLISPNNTPAVNGWTASDLKATLLTSRHDLVFLAGHFSADRALAADFSTTVLTSDLAASTNDWTDSIVFSAGCHSGYNLVDADGIPSVTQTLDWSQAFAQKGATLIAGTGYQYGDTDFVQYSEQIYASFAHELRMGSVGQPVSVGQALVRAKQDYLRTTPALQGIDQKALLESTLFGLPMLSVDYHSGRIPTTTSTSAVTPTAVSDGPGHDLGLSSATVDFSTPTAVQHKTLQSVDGGGTVETTYYSGADGVTSKPFEPALPLILENVSGPDPLRGVGFWAGAYTDQSVVPLSGAATTEQKSLHTPFSSPVFYPARLAAPNFFDALGDGATGLMLTPAQHRSTGVGEITSTLRLYSDIGVKLFYSGNIETRIVGGQALTPALAAQPSIFDVTGTDDGAGHITVDAHVVGDPSAGIQEVWVTYTGFDDAWHSLDLVQDQVDTTHWTGIIDIPGGHDASEARFILQAVNGVGLVGLSDDFGQYFSVAAPGAAQPNTTQVVLAGSPTTGAFGSTVEVSATLSGASPIDGQPIVFSLGGASLIGTTHSDGQATVSLQLNATPGAYSVSASYLGDPANDPSSDSHPFTIGKVGTTIELTGPSTGSAGADSGIVAAVSDDNGAAIGLRTVYFVVSDPIHPLNAFTRTAITDLGGHASLGAVSLPVGLYDVTAHFNGSFALAPAATTVNLADDTYDPSSRTAAYQVLNRTPAFSFDLSTLPAKTFGNPAFGVAGSPYITTDSSGTVSFALGTGSVGCSVTSGGTVTLTGAATGTDRCVIAATLAATTGYDGAGPISQSFAIARANQTITFGALASKTFGNPDFGVSATASSALAVSFTAAGQCTVTGSSVHLTGAGSCTITANQAGNADWNAATPVGQAFSIVNPVPTVTGVVPTSVGRGAISFPLTVLGTGFVPGATVTISGTGVTVNSTAYVDSTHLTASLSVTTSAALTNRNVSVANPGTSTGTCTGCLGINQGPYGIAPVPFSIGVGALNENISVIGFNFVSGTWTPSSVQFSGLGITVNSVTRVNSLLLTVNLSVDPLAATGARSVTVVNPDGGRSTALAAFTVNAAPTITSLSPNSRGQGAANEKVVLTGSGFLSGTWSASSVSFSGPGITVSSVSRTDSSHLSVTLSITGAAATGARDVTVRNLDGGRATKVGGFTVNAGPGPISLNPGARGQGATSQVVTVNGSNFLAGSWPTSAVAFSGSGITVNSVTRTDASRLSVNLSVSTSAAVGARTVTVRNLDGGTASLASGFTVNARPTITSLSPNTRARGQANQTIVVTGTGFASGATVSFSGSGIAVVSVTWTDSSHLSVKISVASGAATGYRNVTVTNPDQGSFTLASGFRVT